MIILLTHEIFERIYIQVDQSPLYIGINDEVMLDSNAFLIPRWGGVCIYNVQGTNEFPVKVHSLMRDL